MLKILNVTNHFRNRSTLFCFSFNKNFKLRLLVTKNISNTHSFSNLAWNSNSKSLHQLQEEEEKEDLKILIFSKNKQLLRRKLLINFSNSSDNPFNHDERNLHSSNDNFFLYLNNTIALIKLLKAMNNKNYKTNFCFKIIFRNFFNIKNFIHKENFLHDRNVKGCGFYLFLIEFVDVIEDEAMLHKYITLLGLNSLYLHSLSTKLLSFSNFKKFEISTKLKILYFITFIIKHNFLIEVQGSEFLQLEIKGDLLKLLTHVFQTHLIYLKDSYELHQKYLSTIEKIIQCQVFPNQAANLLYDYVDYLMNKKEFYANSVLDRENYEIRFTIMRKILSMFKILITNREVRNLNVIDVIVTRYEIFISNLKNLMTGFVSHLNSKESKSSQTNLHEVFRRFLIVLKMEFFIVNFLKDLNKEKMLYASSNDPYADDQDSTINDDESLYFCTPTYNLVDVVVEFLNLERETRNLKIYDMFHFKEKIFIFYFIFSQIRDLNECELHVYMKILNSIHSEFKAFKKYLKSLDYEKNSNKRTIQQFIHVIERITNIANLDKKLNKNFLDYLNEIAGINNSVE
jgi:hypothetical protein